jgi:hypothetical protein
MKPQAGEFWIVEFMGRVTVAECRDTSPPGSQNDCRRWRLFSGAELNDLRRKDFRAVRKIDIAALVDQSAPVAWRHRLKGDRRWTLTDVEPINDLPSFSAPPEIEGLYRGGPAANPFDGRTALRYWLGFAKARMGQMDAEDLAKYQAALAIVGGVD